MTEIRDAIEADLVAITEITNQVVAEGTAIWRDDPVTVEDRASWLAQRLAEHHPVLVAETETGQVAGFATFGEFRPFPGYHPTVEHSIHLAEHHRGLGIGRQLLDALIGRAIALGKEAMIAGVDAATVGSIRFHERAGFREVGHLPRVGRKFGQPVDLVLLQLDLVETQSVVTTSDTGMVVAVDHVQLSMPTGGEDRARAFYGDLLGLPEVAKPAPLAADRGGCWFASAVAKVHLGVEADFRPARKAHPALRVDGLGALVDRLRAAGVTIVDDEPLAGHDRVYIDDPFGNRIELLEPH